MVFECNVVHQLIVSFDEHISIIQIQWHPIWNDAGGSFLCAVPPVFRVPVHQFQNWRWATQLREGDEGGFISNSIKYANQNMTLVGVSQK